MTVHSFFRDVGQGFKNGLDLLGITHYGQQAKEQDLQAKFQQMAEAYKQYRGFAADTRGHQLDTQLALHQPAEQYMHYLLPSYHSTTNQGAQGIRDTIAGIHQQVDPPQMTVGQGWPQIPGTDTQGPGAAAGLGQGGALPNLKAATDQAMQLRGQAPVAKPPRPIDSINNITGPTVGRV